MNGIRINVNRISALAKYAENDGLYGVDDIEWPDLKEAPAGSPSVTADQVTNATEALDRAEKEEAERKKKEDEGKFDLGKVDWGRVGTAAGGAWLAHWLASSLIGDDDEDDNKSVWSRTLSKIIPLGAAGLGAYGGWNLKNLVKFSEDKNEKNKQIVRNFLEDYKRKVEHNKREQGKAEAIGLGTEIGGNTAATVITADGIRRIVNAYGDKNVMNAVEAAVVRRDALNQKMYDELRAAEAKGATPAELRRIKDSYKAAVESADQEVAAARKAVEARGGKNGVVTETTGRGVARNPKYTRPASSLPSSSASTNPSAPATTTTPTTPTTTSAPATTTTPTTTTTPANPTSTGSNAPKKWYQFRSKSPAPAEPYKVGKLPKLETALGLAAYPLTWYLTGKNNDRASTAEQRTKEIMDRFEAWEREHPNWKNWVPGLEMPKR